MAGACAAHPSGGSVLMPSLGKEHEITLRTEIIEEKALATRLERYELQRIAADLLEPFKYVGLSGSNKGKLQPPRVCKCLQVPRKKVVEIFQSIEHQKFFYGGLVICGSVWDCLPCTSKVSEKRRGEIEEAISIWESRGGSVHMMTFTFPHYENQKTGPLLKKFSEARIKMKQRRNWIATEKALRIEGTINRVETTYGVNGAHIHCHELFFSKYKYLEIDSGCIYPMWCSACVDSGLGAPSEKRGVTVSTPQNMAEYVSKIGKEAPKWTIELEMTKGHIKLGKIDGMTPWDLLRAYRDTGDCDYADKFIEYSKAFKGKRQLTWSRGLFKTIFGKTRKEKTDLEYATEQVEDAMLFHMLSIEDWSYIRKYNMRGQLIEVCKHGKDALLTFIKQIKERG